MESAGRFGLDHLARLGMQGDPKMRPTLLRVLTELYVQKPLHTPDEERHYTELALRLLDSADHASRSLLAQRLAQYQSPPRRVLERLAGEHANFIAQPLRPYGAMIGSGNVAGEPRIGVDAASELNELFFAANPDERRLILLTLEVIAPLPIGRIERSIEDGLSARLEAAVLSRNRERFAHDLAKALRIGHVQARRIADDDLGECLVTAAKALNMRRGALYRILLLLNAGRSVARIRALTELHHELPTEAAAQMVAIWRALPNMDGPVEHQRPALRQDRSIARAPTASATAYKARLSLRLSRDAS